MFDPQRGIDNPGEPSDDGYILYTDEWANKFYFKNSLKNYPLSEGDVISILTEKDYSVDEHVGKIMLILPFFYLFNRIRSVVDYVLNKLFWYI